jgi:putative ABC transport system substrate-binding protein
MDRRTFIGVVVPFLALPIPCNAQEVRKVYRIGWLREGNLQIQEPFWDAMRESGWIEGQNVTVEPRYASSVAQLPALARELVQLKVDVIMTDGTPATQAAKSASGTIPIVFAIGADPVERGFATSLAKPGGNLTGFTFGDYSAKQLQILKEALPRASVVVYPVREPNPEVVRGASAVGLRVQAIPVRGPEGLESFFAAVRTGRVDAVVFPNIAWTGPYEGRIAAEALKSRVPLMGTWRNFATSGGLLSYGPNLTQHWPRLAAQVDKILKGVPAGDLPIEQPTKFELVINMKTAKGLGITIPQLLLLRADQVIQ